MLDKKKYKPFKADYRKDIDQNPFIFEKVPGINTLQLNENISIQN